jgi:maltooligosyltrehalose trehalohydrolase
MGEEYGEPARFQYFVSHQDLGLIEAVRRGRTAEFARFEWSDVPPDPQDAMTFSSSKLNHTLKTQGHHRALRDYYRELLQLRRQPAFTFPCRSRLDIQVPVPDRVFSTRRWSAGQQFFVVYHFGNSPQEITAMLPAGEWTRRLDSTDPRWHGPGSSLPDRFPSNGTVTLTMPPHSAVVYQNEENLT